MSYIQCVLFQEFSQNKREIIKERLTANNFSHCLMNAHIITLSLTVICSNNAVSQREKKEEEKKKDPITLMETVFLLSARKC